MEVKHAIEYIEGIIKGLEPTAKVDFLWEAYSYHLTIHFRDQTFSISFGRDVMQDLEQTILNDSEQSDRRRAIEDSIKFKIYILLGKAGIIPEFKISEELLKQKREWAKGRTFGVVFDDRMPEIFLEGLKQLSIFLRDVLNKYKRKVPEFVEDKRRIDSLIKYYSENKTFNADGASAESLSYLKAAAVCQIITKEKEKEIIRIEEILKEIDQEIYYIVSELRVGPFFQIEMPRCLYAYIQETKKETEGDKPAYYFDKMKLLNNWAPFAVNKKVFIAHRFKEELLVNMIKKELKTIDFEFREGKVEDCGFITDDILNKIKECSFFLALITPLKEFKDGKFSTSSWILMEIGAGIALDRNILVLADNHVEQEEYARKLQAETQYEIFNETDFDKKLAIIISRIKKEREKQNGNKI